MRLGMFSIVRPRRAEHWWEGLYIEWGDEGSPPERPPRRGYVRLEVQLPGRRK